MHRLFVALLPPPDVVAAWAPNMAGIEGAHWQRPAQLHLTLAFVGEVDRHGAEALAQALHDLPVQALTLETGPWGAFEGRAGRIAALWATVRGEGLDELAVRVRGACRRAGTAAEGRRFLPHVTLARFGARGVSAVAVRPWLAGAAPVSPWPVTALHLMESWMGSGGSHYESRLEVRATGSSAGPHPR